MVHLINVVKKSGIKPVVCINAFATDTKEEWALVKRIAEQAGARAAVSQHWLKGGDGALDLADAVIDACKEEVVFKPLYPLEMPLRQRVEDIKLLAEYFLQKIANQKHCPPLKLSEEAVRVLESYPWPGNVRELENTLQRATVLSTADILLPKDIPLGAAAPEILRTSGESIDMMPKDRALEVLFQAASEDSELALLPWIEREFTLRAMQKTDNNQVRAAKLLGITRATLRKRLDRNSGIEEIEEE